jgi:hypothetical protein
LRFVASSLLFGSRMQSARIPFLVGALSIALPIVLASGCSSSAPSEVTSLERIQGKDDGPPQDFDTSSDYAVAVQNLHGDWTDDPSFASTRPPLVINLNGLRTSPCVDTDGCYADPDSFDDQRMSGDELAGANRFSVESPDDTSEPVIGPTDGVLGAINSAIQGTGTYRVHIQTHGFKITGVTFEVHITF